MQSILIKDVKKRYGSYEALRGINLNIESGMFGLLGPNGAGKTTLLRILATLLRPTEGSISIHGHDPVNLSERRIIRSQLGYLPQELGFYPDLTGREFLEYMGLLKELYNRSQRRQQIKELLQLVNLTSVADLKVKTYSGGMKRRLGIAQALLGNPHVVIVDEPTSGLDPEERIRLRTLLSNLARNRSVILSTHVVEDIEQTCERIAVLNNGLIAFSGSTANLIAIADGCTWQFQADSNYTLPPTLHIIAAIPHPDGTMFYRVVGQPPVEDGTIHNIQAQSPKLEDGYIWLRQREVVVLNQLAVQS